MLVELANEGGDKIRREDKRKGTEYNYSVIHWLMSYIAFTMLAM
jgi:hypothetical protein